MRKCYSGGDSVTSMQWRVQRSRQPMDLDLTPTLLHSDGTEHIVVFNGVVLRPTPRAVAERGGPTLPFTRPGQGLYFWRLGAWICGGSTLFPLILNSKSL